MASKIKRLTVKQLIKKLSKLDSSTPVIAGVEAYDGGFDEKQLDLSVNDDEGVFLVAITGRLKDWNGGRWDGKGK